MTAVLIVIAVLALLLALAVSIDLAAPAIAEWLRQQRVVRQSALDAKMQAMNAAQQLSFLAWQARHQIYWLGNEKPAPRPSHPSRSTRTRYK